MNMTVRGKLTGALLAAAFASSATCAYAQTIGGTPDAALQKVAVGSPPRHRADNAVIRDVRRAFRRVPGLDDSEIRVRARFGVVTLTGSVPESWQISRAGNAARSVHGVTGVANRLTTHEGDGGH